VAVLVWVVIALLVLANLAAAYPGWRAARLSTAAALRAE
jgi:ABC-type lipoprotein release transport system permease subunit